MLSAQMGNAPTMLEQRTLPPDPASASAARRFAHAVLRQWEEAELADVVALLVSELVTNAVLHAGSQVDVTVSHRGDVLRVEVGDGSSVLPGQRDYNTDASTGRGLGMLELLAERWGVEPLASNGKVVWFELPATHPVEVTAPAPEPPAVVVLPEDEVVIRLLSAPVQLFRAMQEHTDALLREYALISLQHRGPGRAPPHLVVDTRAVDAQLQAAVEAGRTATDLVVAAPASARETIVEASEALGVADRLAANGQLLTSPALTEVRACREWFLAQVVDQLDGRSPSPWAMESDEAERREPVPIEHRAVLDALDVAIVVADDVNHIAYVNDAAAQLFGWPRGLLEGQRLTTLIPQRLHEAHVAGYSRYLVTRRPRLIGHPVRVPARRRDGSEVEVELLLGTVTPPRGRELFTAMLRPVEDPGTPNLADHQWLAVVDGILDRIDQRVAAGPRETAKVVLEAVLAEIGWDFSSWWEPDGETLRCRAMVSPREQSLIGFAAATSGRRFAPGVGLPGRVWQSRQSLWIDDVVSDANFPRLKVALEHGLRTACAIPLIADGQVTGVIELFSSETRRRDEALLAALSTVGRVIATANRS
ncbi:MAG TPA: GAF domain-containing protein [Egibacteraceae bacterium]|nr:GAF domain-containing protein [Egibacteraceae bacterium]